MTSDSLSIGSYMGVSLVEVCLGSSVPIYLVSRSLSSDCIGSSHGSANCGWRCSKLSGGGRLCCIVTVFNTTVGVEGLRFG